MESVRRYSVRVAWSALYVQLGDQAVPPLEELTEARGILTSYSIASGRGRRHALFAVTGQPGRFWNDAVYRTNVETIFTHRGMELRFYRALHNPYFKQGGDAVKTYGLTVDGVEIKSVQQAIEEDSFLSIVLGPLAGIGLLGFAAYRWRRNNRP